MWKKKNKKISGSFRDPSGSLFIERGILFRKVNDIYKKHYDYLIDSGLYDELTEKELLVSHKEVNKPSVRGIYKVIKPELIPFISYPYEWCFSQLKDAALTTLKIQKLALKQGVTLKDASAYNIQFLRGRPILIDTLSFEKYKNGTPWIAYRQFCQHFLAPLLLMAKKDVRLNQLSKIFIDGIPLDLASNLLPLKTYLNFSILSHIHLHAKSQKYFEDKPINTGRGRVGKNAILGMIDNLENTINKTKWEKRTTEWGDYYQKTNYSSAAIEYKKKLVKKFLHFVKPKKSVWDIGANMGLFSRFAADMGLETVSFDIDPVAVEKNYQKVKKDSEKNLLPLLIDLTNPTPSIGWENKERDSLVGRGPADCVLALALIHHLAISNNLPFDKIAEFFSKICTWLIVEFVPKSDSNVQKLLKTREDVFSDYTKLNFEATFKEYFRVKQSEKLTGSKRYLYLMKKI